MDWAPLVRQRAGVAAILTDGVYNLLARPDLTEDQTARILVVVESFCETVDDMARQIALDNDAEDFLTPMIIELEDSCMSLAERVANHLTRMRLRRMSVKVLASS